MADPVHRELDALHTALWDAAEVSSPIVFVTDREPRADVRALMDTLGVPIEVRPVSNATKHSTEREAELGRAAVDYRASVASIHRRAKAGDIAVECPECGTEVDVTTIAHSPRCSRYESPPAAAAKNGAAAKGWEKGRDGRRRSVAERNANGEVSHGELQRRHETFLDSQAMTTRCGVDGCGWMFEGTAAEGREAAAAHRAELHPELGQTTRRRSFKDGQSSGQVAAALEQGLEALEAMDAGEPQPKTGVAEAGMPVAEPAGSASGHGEETGEPGQSGSSRRERGRVGDSSKTVESTGWSRKRIEPDVAIAALQEAVAELGHTPTADQWARAHRRPARKVFERLFGTWYEACTAAGVAPPAQAAAKPRPEGGQQVPIVWQVKVDGTGLRYRTVDEAFVAADEIEHDGERVAREARVAGEEGKADQAVDAARELAEKIRAAARAAAGESESYSNSEPEPKGREEGVLVASPPPPSTGALPPAAGLRTDSPGPAATEPGSGSDTTVKRQLRRSWRDHWTRDRVLERIQQWVRDTGKVPTRSSWSGPTTVDVPNQQLVIAVFGGHGSAWGEAIVAAGYPPPANSGARKKNSSGERAASAPAARGLARPVVERGPDDQQPPMTARMAAATDGAGAPAAGQEPNADEAPPGGELALPDPEQLTSEPQLWIAKLEVEAARLELRAGAYRSIASALQVLEVTAA